MKTIIHSLAAILAMAFLAPLATAQSDRQSQTFKLHNIFSKDISQPARLTAIVTGADGKPIAGICFHPGRMP